MSNRKHVPQRTCVACRRVTAKRELIRLVRMADSRVEVDPGGKKAGRGAYLCRMEECWQSGLKGGRLEHVLKTAITPNDREQLLRYGQSLQ